MWKKMLLVVGLAGSLAMMGRAGEPVPGEAALAAAAQAQEQIKVRIWGLLREVVPPVIFPDGREIYVPDYANRYLAVVVNGRTFKLDFGSRVELWRLAESLKDQAAIVEGDLAGDRVMVSGLAQDPTESRLGRQKIEVEVTGKLDLSEVFPTGPGPHLAIARFDLVVRACGQQFRLNLGSTGLNLWDLNQRFKNETVLVTGTLEPDGIAVREVRGVDSYVKKTLAVQIKGKLERYADLSGLCVPGSPGVVIRWRVHAEGKWYTLEFAEGRNLEGLAEKFQGDTVLVRGTLDSDVVRVTSLELPA